MSTATLSVSTILETLANQKLGFKFGKPDRPSDKSLACILPIIRETTQVRQYVTFPETEKVLVTDSGSIYKINLENTSKDNVFLRSSTMFEGKGTQNRVLSRSAILFPGTKVALDVRCIHQSHGINSGSEFKYGGVSPLSVDAASYTTGYTRRDQSTTWNAVRSVTASMSGSSIPVQMGRQRKMRHSTGSRSLSGPLKYDNSIAEGNRNSYTEFGSGVLYGANVPYVPNPETGDSVGAFDSATGAIGSDNLKKSFDAFSQNFDGILSKARLHDNQAGLALITETGCKTIEAFDVPVSWEALHKDAVKRMGTELLRGEDKTNVFEYKPENAVAAVVKVLSLDYKTNLIYEHKPSNGEPSVKIYGLTASRYVGEVVELDDRVIHMVLLETEN
jgi:hypothetical protein